ncbi:hypothetical protein [Olivibacter sitiensis]|uniref:hypothetical protein n=1 Tax=Olivibacter sitiensis TaxID=376470 RepID=UPI00042948B7|nr:hypothetical protein [Olivibacter sitiensis]
MKRQTINQCLHQLWQIWQKAESSGTTPASCAQLLDSLNTDAYRLLERLDALRQQQLHELQGRARLQRAMDGLPLDEEVFALFCKDQVSFYGRWLARFDSEFSAQGAHCALQLSAREILLVLRLAKDLQLLGDRPLKPLLQFVSLHLRTHRQEPLSYESLRKKYSQLDAETLRQVKQLLIKMNQRINHYFVLLSNK